MQTRIAVHDTDQKQGNVMNNDPKHDNNRKEKKMNVIKKTVSTAVLRRTGTDVDRLGG